MPDLAEFPDCPVASLLAEIDAQQDQVIAGLDDLNAKLEAILKSCAPTADRTVADDVRSAILRAA